MTPEQERRLGQLAKRHYRVEASTLNIGVPAGSELVLGYDQDGRLLWVEIIEPAPSGCCVWDLGDRAKLRPHQRQVADELAREIERKFMFGDKS